MVPSEMNASELLREYRVRGSEQAFGTLVQAYTRMVYSIAKRRLGNAALAEEAAQIVFTRLARTPPKLEGAAALAGWLHRTTVHVSIDLWRAESRRRAREESALAVAEGGESAVWEELAPKLDEALDQLSDSDRQVLLLRFFEHKRNAEVAETLGTTEDAAKMRVSRAVEKLRNVFAAQGVNCATALLARLLVERAVEAAPAGLAVKLAGFRQITGAVDGGSLFHWRMAALGIAGLTLVTVIVSQWLMNDPTPNESSIVSQERSRADATRTTLVTATQPVVSEAFDPITTRTKLRVIEGGSSRPIPSAAVSLTYFYDGGVGEGHKAVANSKGVAALPFPNRDGNPRATIFVTTPGYVPKCVSFCLEFPDEYTLRMDPAETIAGRVLDEAGRPVAGVKVTFGAGKEEGGAVRGYGASVSDPGQLTESYESMAFHAPDAMSVTDAQGLFALPFVPADWDRLNVVLTAENYAITSTNYARGEFDPENMNVVIRSGTIIYGRVIGPRGHPIANASVKELHNYGWRRLATTTAADGSYELRGASDGFEPKARIVVQAEGFAAQMREANLNARTKEVDFRLTPAVPFRGRIVDPNGVPIMGAVIQTDSGDYGIRKYDWLEYSNVDGRFKWNGAPDEEMPFWFEKEGYQTIRGISLIPNGTEYEIVLRPPGREPSSVRAASNDTSVRQPRYTFQYSHRVY